MSNDGKTAGPEASAQREARSEHIPTPEGRGGEAMANIANIADIALQDALTDAPGGSYYDDAKFVAALAGSGLKIVPLSSPRVEEVRRMREALTALRSLVREGGVPRYTVTPGAALNSVIEELVDPALSPPVG